MAMAEKISNALQDAFAPTALEVVDESESHRGHAGYQDGGESHWHVAITAPQFSPMSRLERHRAIHAALGPEIIQRIHALRLTVSG